MFMVQSQHWPWNTNGFPLVQNGGRPRHGMEDGHRDEGPHVGDRHQGDADDKE